MQIGFNNLQRQGMPCLNPKRALSQQKKPGHRNDRV